MTNMDKLRPRASIEVSADSDNRLIYSLGYYCPECSKRIGCYKQKLACDNCGTVFDWRKEARIVCQHNIVWRDERCQK